VASVSISTTGGSVIGMTKPLMPLFPLPGDDPALISSYLGNDNEDSTFKPSKEQPDEAAVVSLARGSFENGPVLIDRERCLFNRESAIAGAFLKMNGVVKLVGHRAASSLRL